jgi:glycosyltransferase involved in cell wall biosynthesis
MYNAAATIGRCLASITGQTTPPAKILVVNDRSTDSSAETVRELHIPTLELIELPENRGVSAARNAGIERAETEFVAFLDADDTWEPRFVELVRGAIEEFGADFGGCGGLRVNRDSAPRERSISVAGPAALDLTDSFWRVALRFMPIHPSAAIARRSLCLAVGGFPEDVRAGEDMQMWIKLWVHGRFAFVNESLFQSVAPPDGISAGELSYHDVRVGLARAGKGLLQAVRLRRRGTGWFGVWFARRLLNRHALWLRRKFARRGL